MIKDVIRRETSVLLKITDMRESFHLRQILNLSTMLLLMCLIKSFKKLTDLFFCFCGRIRF